MACPKLITDAILSIKEYHYSLINKINKIINRTSKINKIEYIIKDINNINKTLEDVLSNQQIYNIEKIRNHIIKSSFNEQLKNKASKQYEENKIKNFFSTKSKDEIIKNNYNTLLNEEIARRLDQNIEFSDFQDTIKQLYIDHSFISTLRQMQNVKNNVMKKFTKEMQTQYDALRFNFKNELKMIKKKEDLIKEKYNQEMALAQTTLNKRAIWVKMKNELIESRNKNKEEVNYIKKASMQQLSSVLAGHQTILMRNTGQITKLLNRVSQLNANNNASLSQIDNYLSIYSADSSYKRYSPYDLQKLYEIDVKQGKKLPIHINALKSAIDKYKEIEDNKKLISELYKQINRLK
jgi:ElaB/YqjD/DUF883 family membrane-anchored ribosome-binding protein/uncharacterized coiled-coil protein SlyX